MLAPFLCLTCQMAAEGQHGLHADERVATITYTKSVPPGGGFHSARSCIGDKYGKWRLWRGNAGNEIL
jgi:hypothetical protein